MAEEKLMDDIDIEELEQAVRQAIMRLSPRCRAVVFLRFFDNLSIEEAAEKSGEMIESIHAYMRQARPALRLMYTFCLTRGGYAALQAEG